MPRSPGNVPVSRSTLSCGVIAWLVSPISVPPRRWRRILPGSVRAPPCSGSRRRASPRRQRCAGARAPAGYDRLLMDVPRERARDGGLLARAPSGALVLGGIASVQFGAALATTLFDTAGPAGTAFLRLAFGSLVLL